MSEITRVVDVPKPKPLGREQYLKDSNPETITVSHADFNGEIMVVNKDTFDPAKMVRVNTLGQKLDERGIVVESEPVAGPGKRETKETK